MTREKSVFENEPDNTAFGCFHNLSPAPFWLMAALVAAAAPAAAHIACGDRSKMIGFLDRDYQESRSGLGLASNGAVVEPIRDGETIVDYAWAVL